MKKMLVLMILLGLVVSANAALTVVVRFPDQPINVWQEYENSKLNISPSDELYIGFADDTIGSPANVTVGDVFYLGISDGPGALDVGPANAVTGVSLSTVDDAQLAADLGIQNNFVMATITGEVASSMVFYNYLFHCEGEGDVTIFAYDENFQTVDTQVIHQTIPEPATLALLGIGGFLLRKRRRA